MEADEQRPPLSKAGKLLAVAGFFLVLFLVAGMIGLPLPLSVVSFFFLTVAAPMALFIAFVTAALFKALARISGRPEAWPFFDVALQTFILAALIATGVFIVRFPGWLEEFYPEIRAEVEGHITSDVQVERRAEFLQALDRFWKWNVGYLVAPGEPPSEIEQQRVEVAVNAFRAAVTPDCADCNPELSRDEVTQLTALMNAVTLGTGGNIAKPSSEPTGPDGLAAPATLPASSSAATSATPPSLPEN